LQGILKLQDLLQALLKMLKSSDSVQAQAADQVLAMQTHLQKI
jgi:hypothetical protein